MVLGYLKINNSSKYYNQTNFVEKANIPSAVLQMLPMLTQKLVIVLKTVRCWATSSGRRLQPMDFHRVHISLELRQIFYLSLRLPRGLSSSRFLV
jgi:hypothetical protein